MKLGILGGTFNPPHIGHLILAQTVLERLSLNKVFFIPTNIPPHKNTTLIDSKHRLEMLKLAIEDNRNFEILDCEIRRGGVSYTIDTVKELTKKYPFDDFFLILGSELANEFYTWKGYEEIERLVNIVVAKRSDYPLKKKDGFITIDIIHIGVTSSLIRDWIKKGYSIRYFVPKKVMDYIVRNNLYL
ncbi:MAG: nicotinate (nicotinamide) nucleotide adenylyltransferase [Candidatus Omnitrophica bacterium]|nr:nicotinate (nicotinamide) nucleotide adenylyltransferase [Candidatus Omnitrophota bacterium]MCM8826743.1 nicotinate (nicotinamide) nucleotide adenylyltransferase [Candidatus Omnitrophota bacterium]